MSAHVPGCPAGAEAGVCWCAGITADLQRQERQAQQSVARPLDPPAGYHWLSLQPVGITQAPRVYVCDRCGAMVGDYLMHNTFHDKIDREWQRLRDIQEVHNLWDGS